MPDHSFINCDCIKKWPFEIFQELNFTFDFIKKVRILFSWLRITDRVHWNLLYFRLFFAVGLNDDSTFSCIPLTSMLVDVRSINTVSVNAQACRLSLCCWSSAMSISVFNTGACVEFLFVVGKATVLLSIKYWVLHLTILCTYFFRFRSNRFCNDGGTMFYKETLLADRSMCIKHIICIDLPIHWDKTWIIQHFLELNVTWSKWSSWIWRDRSNAPLFGCCKKHK